MAPQVLHRVCYGRPDPEPWQKALLTIKPALLHDYSRHKVEGCDYPAIIPVLASTDNKPSTSNAVRGTLVTGLTDGDIWRLDLFEGSQYERKKVKARLLKKVGDESGKGNVEGEEVEAETYVWTAGKDELEEGEWDFGTFKREKLWMWAGSSARGEEYAGKLSMVVSLLIS